MIARRELRAAEDAVPASRRRASATPVDRGLWVQTFTGRAFHYLDPRPEDIKIRDIAHALAHTARFNGHARTFYSVAEHSVILADAMGDRATKLAALLHDAPEAYMGDLPSPLRLILPDYAVAYRKVEEAVFQRFGVPRPTPQVVKAADTMIVNDEADVLLGRPPMPWGLPTAERLGVADRIECLTPPEAESLFLVTFAEVTGPMEPPAASYCSSPAGWDVTTTA